MNILQVILLSIVEGTTEFLPISSTGHLILASNLFKIQQTEFVKSFEIIIQLGAILAVVVIYFKKLITNFDLWKKIIIAFMPSAIFGAIFYRYIKLYLIGNSMVVIWSLLIGGIVMFLFEKYHSGSGLLLPPREISYKRYFLIGIFQIVSMIPGVSRAFATIFGGMVVGMNRKDATEFSFFLAIPTMLGATVLDIYKSPIPTSGVGLLMIGFIGSFITAYIVVKWLIKYVESHNFKIFAWYRILLALLFLILAYNIV